MQTRIVLYAEGAGETAGAVRLRPAPGNPLKEEELGAGHLLVRRALCEGQSVPEDAIAFQAGLQPAGGVPRGSTLYGNRLRVRQLVTFVRHPPDAVVMLVDQDGDRARLAELTGWMADAPVPTVVIAAREEFEAWLVADHCCVGRSVGARVSTPPLPEGLGRGEAKRLLGEWCEGHADPAGVRRTIARTCDLTLVARLCPSFSNAMDALREVRLR